MDSLKDILRQRQSITQPQTASQRLKTYIKKKHGFAVRISFQAEKLFIHAQSSSQTALLNLDKISLEQITGHIYDIKITVRKLR